MSSSSTTVDTSTLPQQHPSSTAARVANASASYSASRSMRQAQPAPSPASVASISPARTKPGIFIFRKEETQPLPAGTVLTTPDIWEAMSTVGDDESRPHAPEFASADAGLVAWDRMDVLMDSYEYGGSRT